MNAQHAEPPAKASASTPYLPLLLLLFVGSGCAALIYEVVWFELLELIIGSSAISTGVLLATFMGGMCIGSMGLPHIVSARRNPLHVYALLESGIGVLGLGILFGLPYLGGVYMLLGMKGTSILLCRGLLCGICLLLPTIFMGATLPAIARCVETTPKGMSWLGFFYGGNTAGAALGSLLAGFYLLRVYDAAFATYVAVTINILMALAALLLTVVAPHSLPGEESEAGNDAIPPGSWAVFVTISFSGMTALGAEVVWTRLLALMLGATVYAFSLILAVFLLGLGIGSGIGSVLVRSIKSPRAALGRCQLLLMGGIAWAGLSLVQILPYWPASRAMTAAPARQFLVDFAKSAVVAFPAACLWGASFPLALAAVVSRRQDPGRLVGSVYAANTIGAIFGALGTSLLIIGWLGTHGAQRAMIALTAAGALLIMTTAASMESGKRGSRARAGLRIALMSILAIWVAAAIRPVPGLVVAYGRNASRFAEVAGEFLYVGEGMNSSLAVSRLSSGVLNYHNAGKIQASSEIRDMRLQRMLGHLTTLVPEHPRSVLVIGCGAGVTAGAVSIDPAVEHVTIAEIERLVPQVVSAYFSRQNFDVIRNPKVRLEIDDARHYVMTTREKFDAITSDPFDPWVKGAATLYTKEFFDLLKQHLNPGGVVTVFVQLYQSNVEAVKSQFATFFEVFPNGTVWLNTDQGEGYDVVLLGQVEPTRVDLELMQQRLSRPEYTPVVLSLGEIEFFSAEDLFSTFGGLASDLKPWLQDAQINRDRNLRLQYLAGLAIGLQRQDAIYREFVKLRRFPETLFSGSPERLAILKEKIEAALW
jgi:spermidine synthase